MPNQRDRQERLHQALEYTMPATLDCSQEILQKMNLKRGWFWLGGSAIVLVLLGCFLLARWDSASRLRAALPLEEQQVLTKGEPFILYSLHPRPMEVDPQELRTKPVFHGYLILGQTHVTSAETRTD